MKPLGDMPQVLLCRQGCLHIRRWQGPYWDSLVELDMESVQRPSGSFSCVTILSG